MTNLKILCLLGLALAAIASISAPAASAETSLPSFLFLPGTTEGALKVSNTTAKVRFTGIQNLTGTGYLFELFGTDMAELGLAKLSFTGLVLGAKKCNTEGDASGTILIDSAEWHLALGLAGEPLIVILLPAGGVHQDCEGVFLTLTGSMEWKITKGFGAETGTLEAETGACTGSTPAFSEYDNMTGTMSKVELKSEVGGIKNKSCLEIEGKIVFTASQDLEIMEP